MAKVAWRALRGDHGSVRASPTVRRRRLTAELCRLREVSGRTIDDVAKDVGISKSSLSRIENGLVVPRIPVLRALLTAYGVDREQAQWLEQLCRDAAAKGWWELAGTAAMRDATRMLIGLEAEATRSNWFNMSIISGLLQIRSYAQATLRTALPDLDEGALEALVEARLQRQDRLGDVCLWVILAEEVLMRPVGGPATMRAQVERLLDVASSGPRSTIQVLGRESGEHPGMSGPFIVMEFDLPGDPDVVYVEGNLWDALIEDPHVVDHYKRNFQTLQAMALSPAESKARLLHYVKEYTP